MVERNLWLSITAHLVLLSGVVLTCLPVYYAMVASTLTPQEVIEVPMTLVPGDQFMANAADAWDRAELGRMFLNSLIVAVVVAVGKIAISMMAAFAVTYFSFRLRAAAFWLIFCSLMVPVEVRIVPTYEVVANVLTPIQRLLEVTGLDVLIATVAGIEVELKFSLLNSFAGLTIPLIASATATFLFRQFFLSVPEELADAAKIDGAGPWRFFSDILVPLSRTNMAAIFVIMFIYGWNQYLWPLLVTTSDDMNMVAVGVSRLIPLPDEAPNWHVAMAGVLTVMAPPVLIVIFMQRAFVRGLVDTDR